jgi:alpha-beta hydrolase superfamily lysophospholipase
MHLSPTPHDHRSAVIEIPAAGGVLSAALDLPERLPAPAIVCCHGLISSKDSSKFVALGSHLRAAGYAAIRFDFRGCGDSTAVHGESVLADRMSDLRGVIAHVLCQPWASGRLGLLGSSLGGYLALLTAAQDERVHAVVGWATPFSLARVRLALEQQREALPASVRGRVLGTPEDLAGLPSLERVMLLHGMQDELVDWRQALQLYDRLGNPKELFLLASADHRFLDPAWRAMAASASRGWFDRHVGCA